MKPEHKRSSKPEHKRSSLNRLESVRGHPDAVIKMVDEERYCPKMMSVFTGPTASIPED